jgi:hypothetical protein
MGRGEEQRSSGASRSWMKGGGMGQVCEKTGCCERRTKPTPPRLFPAIPIPCPT